MTSHVYSVRSFVQWLKSRTVTEISYSDWCPVTVTSVKYLSLVHWLTSRNRGWCLVFENQGYETSATLRDVSHGYLMALYETFGHYTCDWSLAYSFIHKYTYNLPNSFYMHKEYSKQLIPDTFYKYRSLAPWPPAPSRCRGCPLRRLDLKLKQLHIKSMS